MFSTKKYLPVLAAFAVGVIGAAGYAVHAASMSSSTTPAPQAQTTAQDPNNADGETADDAGTQVQTTAQDPKNQDGEQADDTAGPASGQHEAESGPGDTGPDNGEAGN